ncbi:MAG: SHOCT domain-containing protein [Actinomycetes bacterium]
MNVHSSVVAQIGPRFGGHFASHDGHPVRWVIGLLLLAVAVAAIVVAIVALVRSRRAEVAAPAPEPGLVPAPVVSSARAILDERLARGEIDPADYEARRSLLG